jgi:hypothetical protein
LVSATEPLAISAPPSGLWELDASLVGGFIGPIFNFAEQLRDLAVQGELDLLTDNPDLGPAKTKNCNDLIAFDPQQTFCKTANGGLRGVARTLPTDQAGRRLLKLVRPALPGRSEAICQNDQESS